MICTIIGFAALFIGIILALLYVDWIVFTRHMIDDEPMGEEAADVSNIDGYRVGDTHPKVKVEAHDEAPC